MVTEGFIQSQSMPKPDRSKLKEYPSISLEERDRRWGLIRNMMEENDVGALMVVPGMQFDDPSNYLTNSGSPMLFFPLKGEPIAFLRANALAIDTQMKSEAYGIKSWVKEARYMSGGEGDEWVNILKDYGLTGSRIGTVASGHFARLQQQRTANALINTIKSALPNVDFVDLWKQYVQIFQVKSDEELNFFRKAALAGEVAAEEFVNACKPGNTVADVQNAVMSTLIPYGVDIRLPGIGCGPHGGRGLPWMQRGMNPPVINNGDLLTSELFIWVGSLHAQVQMAVSIGEPNEEKKKLAALTREAYENGVETIRPGITWGEVSEAMNKPNRREGAWKVCPLAHSLNPIECVDNHPEGMLGPNGFPGLRERFGDLNWELIESSEGRPRKFEMIIQEGSTFQFEPNSNQGQTYVTIGGNIIITKDGCEELNKISTQMIVVPS
ncbi:M24 family metallopeptidase [Thermodesulfobacteriota bacterium]